MKHTRCKIVAIWVLLLLLTMNSVAVAAPLDYAVDPAPNYVLDTPQGLMAKSSGYNSVSLKWKVVKGAEKYILTYGFLKDGFLYGYGPKSISVDIGNVTSYQITGLRTATEHSFFITAYATSDGIEKRSKTASVKATPITSAPANFTATPINNEKIKLKWDKSPGANGYHIYRSTTKNGAYTKIKTVTKDVTTCTVSSNKAKVAYYKITPYRGIAGESTEPIYVCLK